MKFQVSRTIHIILNQEENIQSDDTESKCNAFVAKVK